MSEEVRMPASPEYHRPRSLEEAWGLLESQPDARLVAGGTDVFVRLREGRYHPPALVSLRRVESLRRIEPGREWTIGAGVTVAELLEHEELSATFPVVAEAGRRLGSVQIRSAATVGGNLCNASPCADLAPPLLVLEARARLASAAGEREVPLAEFFLGPRRSALRPGELLTALVVEVPPVGARATFLKQGRVRMDIALASVAVRLDLEGRRCAAARVAAGSLAPTPTRLPEVESLLEGTELGEDALARAREAAEREVRPITDVRASADYRRHLAGALVARAVRALTRPEPQ